MKEALNTRSAATTHCAPLMLPGERTRSWHLTGLSVCGVLAIGSLALHAQTARGTEYGTVAATTPGTTRMAAGLQVSVRITQGLNSKTAAEGDEWDGVTAADLVVGGHLLTPAGTQVTGVVAKAISARRALGDGTLSLRLTSIHGIGVSSAPTMRQGVNPALTSTGNTAAAGIPGEASATTAGAPANALAEARYAPGAVVSFTTE